ncbi:winged helix-turn-helix domain-containing protein [Paraburkholderia sp. MMS20-SJTR3]|uniref:Winged helix-turn-helix domain-containing protein n=1 Tax=Paraburkholderia sejongensis TaxID=2886946 RepID=A0ABS8JZQ4_9BURK|nr:winged helix-turn-helix domain-containing protein [Paraburkholderia sp. MMS20-SJTR3]MCC8395393.1 winged helix-turn-helix domain-containing protein [Paraburkholderia sp. MMS20-SJTR3]
MDVCMPHRGDFAFGATIVAPRRREVLHHGIRVDIGDRAFDLLLLLAQSRGSVLSKQQIIASVWHDRVVERNSVEAQVSALRRALGDDRAAIRTVTGRGYQFIAELFPQPANPDKPPAPPTNGPAFSCLPLPAEVSPLIGQEVAIREICRRLQTHRLVTLVGTGGVGKTRLALEAARQSAPDFADGAFVAELAAATSTDHIPTTIAVALGFPPGDGTSSLDRLAPSLMSRHLLLVLDNCEHLIDGAARIAERLLHIAPRAVVLATSREPLRVAGELVYRVPSLEVPPDDNCDDALDYSAVRLFEERVGAHAGLSPDSRAALRLKSQICRQLDGIPLALELAAACVTSLGLQGVADGLGNRFQLLTHGLRTVLPRQQTLRAALDWSYDLLSDEQRSVLNRLSLFAGTFTLASAQEMASCEALAPDAVVTALMQLVDKSLVSMASGSGIVRYRLLESTRAYARDALRASGAMREWSRRHASYFLETFRTAARRAEAHADVDWRNGYVPHLDDLRAAMQWCFSAEGDMTLAVELTVAGIPFLTHLALLQECLETVDKALEWLSVEGGPVDERHMKLHAARGMCLLCHTVATSTSDAFESAVGIAARLGNLDFQLLGMWGRWMCHYLNGEYAQAIPLAHHFNELASTSSRKCDHLAALRLSGMSRLFAGDLAGALADLQRAANDTEPLPRAQRMRFLYDEKMLSHASLALTLWFIGETELARQAAQQSLDDAREFDHPVSICYALSEAVCTLALLRDDAAALEEAVSSLAAETRRHSISTWCARAQMWQGLLDLRAGDTTVFARTISPAMTSIGSKRFYVSLSPYVTALAEALCRRGMISEAAEVIDASVARATRTDDKCALPELWRAKAEVLVASNGDEAIPAAESILDEALQMARTYGFLAWQTRCSMSLARLGHMKGDAKAALDAIFPVTQQSVDASDIGAAGPTLTGRKVNRRGRPRRY